MPVGPCQEHSSRWCTTWRHGVPRGRCVAMLGLSGHLKSPAGGWTGILLHTKEPFQDFGTRFRFLRVASLSLSCIKSRIPVCNRVYLLYPWREPCGSLGLNRNSPWSWAKLQFSPPAVHRDAPTYTNPCQLLRSNSISKPCQRTLLTFLHVDLQGKLVLLVSTCQCRCPNRMSGPVVSRHERPPEG